jgi:hypothetical protein
MGRLNKYDATRRRRVLLTDAPSPSVPSRLEVGLVLTALLTIPVLMLLSARRSFTPLSQPLDAVREWAPLLIVMTIYITLPLSEMIRRAIRREACRRSGDPDERIDALAHRLRAERMLATSLGVRFFRREARRRGGSDHLEMIVFRHAWPAAHADETFGEAIDLVGSGLGPQERKGVIWSAVLWTPLAATLIVGGLLTPMRTLGILSVATAIIPYALLLLWLAIRLDLTPITIGGAQASPRSVETLRRGRTTTFQPEDTLLILEQVRTPLWWLRAPVLGLARLIPGLLPALRRLTDWWARRGWLGRWRRLEQQIGAVRFRPPIRAVFIREDGRRWSKVFLSGRNDPTLASLVARWTLPAEGRNAGGQ